ncbi:hypothetical protein ACHAWU_002090 [Discostella pseudostelligera]|uniref:Fe2OG dioxygenase domain-containing protein n=1 Tax=Discostella pseudostelligera TaxID=259834 RepID=A0ABD3M5M3_9STRA
MMPINDQLQSPCSLRQRKKPCSCRCINHYDQFAMVSAVLLLVGCILFSAPAKATAFCNLGSIKRATPQSNYVGRGSQSTTALKVSELHVPGYAQTKLPFIHPDDNRRRGYNNSNNGDSTSTTIFHERTYQPNVDYTSLVPHQNGHLIHRTTTPIFTPRECQSIINEAEAKANEMGWTTTRHGNYPTTDLPIVELPTTLEFLKVALVERIYPLLRQQFGEFLPDGGRNLRVADGFIVKYDALGGQTELKPHRDGSVLSFNIALNPMSEFEGGGTWFQSLDGPVKIDQGEIVSHSSSLLHGGNGITWGRRYIIVCFVILEGYDSWSMRFYNQVRNL